jgi:hypothetical protein
MGCRDLAPPYIDQVNAAGLGDRVVVEQAQTLGQVGATLQ